MLTLIESLKEIEKTFDPSKSNSKKYPIRGQSREDWDKGRVGRTKMDLIKEEYDMFSLKGIISLKNLEKSMDMSVALHNKFITSDKYSKVKPMSFIEFYSRLIHWEKLYGTSDSKVKELQKFYRRRNKEIKNFESFVENQNKKRIEAVANKTKRKRGRPRTKNIETHPPLIDKIPKRDFLKYFEVKSKLEKIDEHLDKNKNTMKNTTEIPPLPLHFRKKLTNQYHNNDNHLSTKLSTSVKERFEKHCSKKGKSPSTLIREILITYLQKKDFQERVHNHIAQTEIGDQFRDEQAQLDAQLSWNVTETITLKAEALNLTDEIWENYYVRSSDGKRLGGTQSANGRRFFVGASMRF